MKINRIPRKIPKRNLEHDTRYDSRRWRSLRKQALARDNYLCQECLKNGKLTAGNIGDHIHNVKQGGAFWELTNIQTMCASCHAKKSATEKI